MSRISGPDTSRNLWKRAAGYALLPPVAFIIISGAGAQAQGGDEGIAANAFEFLLGAALIVTLVAIVISAFFLGRRALERARRVHQPADMAASLVNSAPVGAISWDSEGDIRVSGRLVDWLKLSAPPLRLDELLDPAGEAGFPGAEFARIEEAIFQLQHDGGELSPFEVSGSGRRFRAQGHSADDGGDTRSGVIWFEDITRESERLAEERRRVEDLLMERAAFAATLDAFDIPVWRRGPDYALSWVNRAYVTAVEGESADQVIRDGVELVANAISGGARTSAARAATSGEIQKQRHYVVIGGQRRAIRVADLPLEAGEGGDSGNGGVAGYAVDVTDLEDLRAEFGRHTESHAETLNKLSTAVAIFRADKTLEFYNSAFARLWGLPEDFLSNGPHHGELLETMREKRLLPEQADFPAWKRQHLGYYTDLLEPLEEMWHLPDSSTIRVVSQPHPLGGLLILFEDVTDRLALERSYNTLIAVQRATLDNLHEAIAVFGSDGRLKLHNPVFARIWRLDEAELLRAPHMNELLDRCAPLFDSPAALQSFRDRILPADEERVVQNGRLSRADRSEIDFTAVPLPDGASLLTFTDVTDSIRIERALRERNEALETADRLKTEFVAHISYELRTPLNSIIGFAELLDKEYYGPLNAQQHNYSRNILESSEQLLLLINDILDIAVIEAGGMMLELAEVDAHRLLEDVAALVREEARKNEQMLDVECARDIGAVEADERRLKQVLFNLLSNAMKFTPPKGHITLGAKAVDGEVLLSVRDTGVGIPKSEQRRVFDRFETGSNASQGEGVGLGLSLVQNFVALHGGEVEMTSDPGRGTEVVCRLPRHQKAAAPSAGKPTPVAADAKAGNG